MGVVGEPIAVAIVEWRTRVWYALLAVFLVQVGWAVFLYSTRSCALTMEVRLRDVPKPLKVHDDGLGPLALRSYSVTRIAVDRPPSGDRSGGTHRILLAAEPNADKLHRDIKKYKLDTLLLDGTPLTLLSSERGDRGDGPVSLSVRLYDGGHAFPVPLHRPVSIVEEMDRDRHTVALVLVWRSGG